MTDQQKKTSKSFAAGYSVFTRLLLIYFLASFSVSPFAAASISGSTTTTASTVMQQQRLSFDIPVTYNSKVKWWIQNFQGSGKKWFKTWLERSNAYLPHMQSLMSKQGLPQDLAYISMIESGFSAHATSTMDAVGYWQFIGPTANRYGLTTSWWLDERRDFLKSTTAASKYLEDLYRIFKNWYLTAAAYNMGETRLKRLIEKHGTQDFWVLSKMEGFPQETREYIPKLLAAVLISKSPKLYGFADLNLKQPYRYEYFQIPGGTDLYDLAQSIGVEPSTLLTLNPELLKGFVPSSVKSHRIRIPSGHTAMVSRYVKQM